MKPTDVSDEGVAVIGAMEGEVLRAYKDSVGVWTIGNGATNGSAAFRDWAKKKWGRQMRRGDTITRQESREILVYLLGREFAPAVARNCAPDKQHEFDAATSACYNLGAGASKWRWGRALKAGDVRQAGQLLLSHDTAGGHRLAGLTRRRQLEARWMVEGKVPKVGQKVFDATPEYDEEIAQWQKILKSLGYYKGAIDGIAGPQGQAAVLAFQRDHPDLENDGLLGPATRAQLLRMAKARNQTGGCVATGAGTAAGAEEASQSVEWAGWFWLQAALAVIVVVVLAWVLWRYRTELKIWGRRVWAWVREFVETL